MFQQLGPLEIGLIALVIVLIFGVGKLGDVGGAVGKSIREFRKAARDPGDDEETAAAKETGPVKKKA